MVKILSIEVVLVLGGMKIIEIGLRRLEEREGTEEMYW